VVVTWLGPSKITAAPPNPAPPPDPLTCPVIVVVDVACETLVPFNVAALSGATKTQSAIMAATAAP